MHINFNEEQTMLSDSADKFLRDHYSFDMRQSTIKSAADFSAETWSTFAELGWLALPFSENDGGFGWGALELMLLSEKLGRYQVIEPYLDTVVLAGGLISQGDNQTIKDEYLAAIIDGSCQGAFAYAEHGCDLPTSGLHTGNLLTVAEESSEGFVVNGCKRLVSNGNSADFYVVSASLKATPEATVLLCVPSTAEGIHRKGYKTYDGRAAAEISFDNVRVPSSALLCSADQTTAVVEAVINNAIVCVCAEALGAMEAALNATVDYTGQRSQFGQPIGRFQALRHRMADMFMQVELTRSLLMACAWHLDQKSEKAPQLVAALKAKIGSAGRFVTQNAIQLHGGIGVTDELNVGHFFKRLTVIENLFGSRDVHLSRYHQTMDQH